MKMGKFLGVQLPECEESLEHPKDVLQSASKHVLDKKKRNGVDWFHDLEEEIRNLLKGKKLSGNKHAPRNETRKLKNK